MKPVAANSLRIGALKFPSADPALWPLDPKIAFLNHGSFGSCPRPILAQQSELRERMERQPIQFFVRDLENFLDEARHSLAAFLGAESQNLVFVPNSTAGVNTVLRALEFSRGDELVVTNHEYNACRNALNFVAARSGARVAEAKIPFPLHSEREIVEPIMRAVTKRTRLVLLDHVTSQTSLIFPLEKILGELNARKIDALIDGAHAPGMIPVNLRKLRPAYYTGNCHKWLCAPKGAAFLYVRPDRQKLIRPLSISHGANSPRKDRSKYLIEFGWTGTSDPSACLSVPAAISFVNGLLPGGWPEIMQRNGALALAGRKIVCGVIGQKLPCPDELVGSIASIPLPRTRDRRDGENPLTPALSPKGEREKGRGREREKGGAIHEEIRPSPLYNDPLQERLLRRYGIEVPIIPWPCPPHRLLRISAHLYNSLRQYELLAEALTSELHPG